MSDLNLYNVVDNLVMVRNSLNDFVNSKVKDVDSGEIHFYISKLNKEIKNVQKFYPYVDYDKMISDDR